MKLLDLFGGEVETGALFSSERVYRYSLFRKWSAGPTITFVMLNPSTADEDANDPTVAKCVKLARLWRLGGKVRYGKLIVVNIFAYRSTDPEALYALEDPVGPNNNAAITEACRSADTVVVAWGNHGSLKNRGREVARLLQEHSIQSLCFKQNKDGSPMHPLYVPDAMPLSPFAGYAG